MHRPRGKGATGTSLTSGQAVYVLNRIMKERRVPAREINRYVSEMGREIEELESQLAALKAAHGMSAATPPVARRGRAAQPKAAAAAKAAPAKKRRKKNVSPEQLESQKLQGRYLGLVRQFSESKRRYFAKIAKDKGREVAIKEMLEARKK